MSNQQKVFFKTSHQHRYSHGGVLRRKAKGRGQRPLACKEVLHAVFKIDRTRLKHQGLRCAPCFQLVHQVIRQYSKKFFVKIEKMSVQGDHLHLVLRTTRRSHFHYFFRVVAGQIAQRFQQEGLLYANAENTMTDTPHGTSKSRKSPGKGTRLWLYRPFSRVVIGRKAYVIVINYVELNEQEALGKIKYQKQRLRGLSSSDWQILWT